MFLNKPRLPTENLDQLFSVKLFGNTAFPVILTFYFSQSQVMVLRFKNSPYTFSIIMY